MESDGIPVLESAPLESYRCSNPHDHWRDEDEHRPYSATLDSREERKFERDDQLLIRKCFPSQPLTNKAYESWLTRRMSFINWPEKSTGQFADELASAGFVYTHKADHVKCATCNIKLGNWKRTDCPFFEHVRHNQHCSYINSREKPYQDLLKQDLAWEKVKNLCKMCRYKRSDMLLLPCRHKNICKTCLSTAKHCPTCYTSVNSCMLVKQ